MTLDRPAPERRICSLHRLFTVALWLLFVVAPAAAQTTTITLAAPGTELTDDVTIRGGGYAGVNYSTDDSLVTKTSSDTSNVRRVLLKFDTAHTIPAGATIVSATLTLTLKSAGAALSRPIAAYRVTKSFLKSNATWLQYRSDANWASVGGDVAERWATIDVGRGAGATVTFDLTRLVQQTVAGTFGTRYTRFALEDTGTADNESMRVFHSSRAVSEFVRPKLVVTYDSVTAAPTTPVPSTALLTTTLKAMTFNTHHGVGTDGRYDLNRIATVIADQRPDMVSLNEVMYNSSYGSGENQPATYKSLLQQKTGQTWYAIYARMDGNWSSTNWAVGNLLLSRIPFSTTTRYALSYDRAVAQGTIVLNGRTINLFSTHVDYANASYRTMQTQQLETWASSWAENRIIMGDFNTTPGTGDYNIMANHYYDAWAEAVKKGIYSSSSGTAGYTHGGSRFDYVYQSKGASALTLTRAWVVSSNGASDHDPVVATFTVQ
jgi:endonuclease/exonuclease/phosphatase family metal-dependent hydrolase